MKRLIILRYVKARLAAFVSLFDTKAKRMKSVGKSGKKIVLEGEAKLTGSLLISPNQYGEHNVYTTPIQHKPKHQNQPTMFPKSSTNPSGFGFGFSVFPFSKR